MKTRPAGIGNANADWMGSLPPSLRAMPLKHLAVPGERAVRKSRASKRLHSGLHFIRTSSALHPPVTPVSTLRIPTKLQIWEKHHECIVVYFIFICWKHFCFLPYHLFFIPLLHVPIDVYSPSPHFLSSTGSHDSFTYWVDVHAPVGPDQKPYVKYLATMFSVLAKKVMVKWSMTQVKNKDSAPCTKTSMWATRQRVWHITWHFWGQIWLMCWAFAASVNLEFDTHCLHSQNLTFKEQLDAGIRYFDLRVSSKPGEPGNEIYFIHGLFGHKVSIVTADWHLKAYHCGNCVGLSVSIY